jgi:hypothetical protein
MAQSYITDGNLPYGYCGNTYAAVGMPIFYSGAEYALHKTMGRELVESLIKQQVVLYRVDQVLTDSNFYGESKVKNWKELVTLIARVQIADTDAMLEGGIRKLKKGDMIMHVYNDHLADQNVDDIYVGDFLKFEHKFYEVFDNGPNDDENQRRLGVDRQFYRTVLAHTVESDVFSGK